MIIPFLNRFLHWMVMGIMTTVMSLMILSRGVSIENLGIIGAIVSIIVVLLEFPSGILSDSIGRKRIYLISIGFSLAARFILIWAEGFMPILFGFALYAVSRAFSSGSIEAVYINDYINVHGKENLHKLMSVISAGETAGLASGALLGGFLPLLWEKLWPASDRYNGNLVAQILILLALLALTLLTTKKDEPPVGPSIKFGDYVLDSLRIIRGSRILGLLLAGTCLWGFTFSAIEVYWQPRLKEILGSDQKTWIFGIVNSGYFIASLAGVLLVGLLLSRRRIPHLFLLFLLRIAAGVLILALALQKTTLSFSVFYLTMFLFNGMANVPENTIFNVEIPEDRRSSMLSLGSLAVQLGGAAGSLAFAALVTRLMIPGVWIIAGAIFSASSLLYLRASSVSGQKIGRTIKGQ